MPKGFYQRTKPVWNKGSTKYEKLINSALVIIYESPECPTLGEVFKKLVAKGEISGDRNGYKRFLWVASRFIDKRLLRDGRGLKNKGNTGDGYGRPAKFQIGDKVRICRENKRTPAWLRNEIRIDIPRTITDVFKTGRGALYHVGINRIGSELIGSYAFRSNELIPFVKGKLGRPKTKRVYQYGEGPKSALLSITGVHYAFSA